MVSAVVIRSFVLLVLALATPAFLVNCANEQEKPLEQAEEAADLEDAQQLQPQPEDSEQDKLRAGRSEYVALVTQVLECQVGEATEGMSEQEADTYLAEVFDEAHNREDAAAQDILAENGYDCGWKELQASGNKEEQDLLRSPKIPFSD